MIIIAGSIVYLSNAVSHVGDSVSHVGDSVSRRHGSHWHTSVADSIKAHGESVKSGLLGMRVFRWR